MNSAQAVLQKDGRVSLESVISTAELQRRPTRPADYVAENKALIALAREMVISPHNILQKLAEAALSLCHAGSAGISLLEPDGQHFHWPAVTGAWASHVGGGTPREYGPCGTVLDRNAPQLMSQPERHFTYLAEVTPGIEEALLIPFYIHGKAVGTIWVIAHDNSYRFEAEDLRVMTNLSIFAAAAYQMLASTARTESTQSELQHTLGTNETLLNDIREKSEAEATLGDFSVQIMQAQDEERRRIARELHDTTGQVLAALGMNLSRLKRSSPPEMLAKFEECLELTTSAAAELRNLSYLLHPPLMDELGLGSAITEYAGGFENRSGLKIQVEISREVGRIEDKREIALFRIVQEALGNVHRHSGSLGATIKLSREEQKVVLEISDQGKGMPLSANTRYAGGVGLRSMRERIRPFGGILNIESSASGTRLKIVLPGSPRLPTETAA